VHTLHKPVSVMFATLNGLLQCLDLVLGSVTTDIQVAKPVPGQASRGHPRRDCASVTVAHGITSVIISWWAYCSSARALGHPLFPSADTRLVAVVLRVQVLRSTHKVPFSGDRDGPGVTVLEQGAADTLGRDPSPSPSPICPPGDGDGTSKFVPDFPGAGAGTLIRPRPIGICPKSGTPVGRSPVPVPDLLKSGARLRLELL
jgi:hypothetical protein